MASGPVIGTLPPPPAQGVMRARAGRAFLAAAGLGLACLAATPCAWAHLSLSRTLLASALSDGSATQGTRAVRSAPRTRASAAVARPAAPVSGLRSANPVIVASSAAAGQTGYVHFFQIRLPDGTPEIQVGIELHDQRIAWSFPGLGVAISPFIEDGVLTVGGEHYEVWHLYGIRPFPDDATMRALHSALAGRIEPWVRAATPYCGIEVLGGQCMSCLGFVLRALFPGRGSAYPDLPGDFWRAGWRGHYSTNDLLLYLAGMLEIPTREARLQRIAHLKLPDRMRDDLEELVYSMGAAEMAASTSSGAAPKRPARQSSRAATRPDVRRKL